MKLRNNVAITLILAFSVVMTFQAFPLLGLNSLEAQESLLPMPMPTYDLEKILTPDGVEVFNFPDLGDPPSDYDGHIFRTVECKVFLIVDIEDLQVFLEGTGWEVFPDFYPGMEEGETIVEISWLYRIFSQWLTYDEESTYEAIGSVSIGTLARHPEYSEYRIGFLVLANVRSPDSAVDLTNETIGNESEVEVSRKGHLDISFKSKSKPDRVGTLRFKAMVKEPISGLKVNVDATFAEGQKPVRAVRNPGGARILFMDLSTFPATEGRPFKWWVQQDRYDFDESTQAFELKVMIPGNKLKLPGNRILPVKRVQESLSLRRNIEGYAQFID